MTKLEVGIKDGGRQPGITKISAFRQNRNEILTAMPIFSGSSYPMEWVVMLMHQTESMKFKMVASNFNFDCHFGFHAFGLVENYFNHSHWITGPRKHRFSHWDFVSVCVQAEISVCHFLFWFGNRHLNFLLPVRSDSISNESVSYGFLGPSQRCIKCLRQKSKAAIATPPLSLVIQVTTSIRVRRVNNIYIYRVQYDKRISWLILHWVI